MLNNYISIISNHKSGTISRLMAIKVILFASKYLTYLFFVLVKASSVRLTVIHFELDLYQVWRLHFIVVKGGQFALDYLIWTMYSNNFYLFCKQFSMIYKTIWFSKYKYKEQVGGLPDYPAFVYIVFFLIM